MSLSDLMPERTCHNHNHITEKTKTDGTPYVKGYCQKCKSWVYTDKVFCVCCGKRVLHKVHHLKLKTILNGAVQIHERAIEEFKLMPYASIVYVDVTYMGRRYHIPLKYLALYSEHPHPNEIMSLLQDTIAVIRGN